MPDGPLAGRGIAITRPLDQAHALAGLIEAAGGHPILFPLLAIVPLDDYRAFDQALTELPATDWAIFISSNAVEQGMPRLLKRFPVLPDRLRFAAIGPSTAAALRRHGIDDVIIPQTRHDSEQLLALPAFRDPAGQRVMIFRGVGGRELLAETLASRGAIVAYAECYRRVNPQSDAGDLPRLWQNNHLHALVVTSSEALRALWQLAPDAEWLRATPLCVNHPRIAEQARLLGLQAVTAEAPDDAGMLQCLIQETNR